MEVRKKIALFMILAAINLPGTLNAAEEDKELSLIAAEQERSGEDEQLDEINPALKESLSTERTPESAKEIKERKKKLKETRKEKEKINEQKLKDSGTPKDKQPKDKQPKEEPIVIEPTKIEPKPEPQPVVEPNPQPQPITEPKSPLTPPQTVDTVALPNQKLIYSNFTEVSRAVKFVPLYMPKKSGYEITAIYAGQGIAEVRYGRRWEPTVSLTVRTYKRKEGEEPQDISGVTGVKWRVDTTTGTTIYIAKISDTQQVAAWAVGHYTFSAQAENLSYAGFHSLVADELVELSTHYYLDF